MSLSLKQTSAVSAMAAVLYDFLPGSGSAIWKGHVNFGTVASKLGLSRYWPGGSKMAALNSLLSQTLEHERSTFERLVIEIVRNGIAYRNRRGRPVTTSEIDSLNEQIYRLGFKFPDLWDEEFRRTLAKASVPESQNTDSASPTPKQDRPDLRELKDRFFLLSSDPDRQNAGLALEGLLNHVFAVSGLDPRRPFRIVGEQIDGSFDLDAQIYLVEVKWEKEALSQDSLLVFRGKIEGKSTFTRGVFIALNGVTGEARAAITQGKSPSFFVMDGYDLLMILSEVIGLKEFLRKRIRLLAEEGRVCAAFSELA
jgi:hypothetical protein